MTETLSLDKDLHTRKGELVAYFRSRASEAIAEIKELYGEGQRRERATAVNGAVLEERNRLIVSFRQHATREDWGSDVILPNALMITYCAYVVMLESRHSVWPYEYMAFSRRVGELWEPFCAICFEFPIQSKAALFIPPLFRDVKARLAVEVREYIALLPLTAEQRTTLLEYYDQAWSLVASGEINLALDLHFELDGVRHVIDFKSGFGSSEKGNTNRLLLVASVYRNIEHENYVCELLVRSLEGDYNNYLKVLRNSGLWNVYCGDEAYERIKEYSGFDLKSWMNTNALWSQDLDATFREYLDNNDLMKYLAW